MSFSRNTRYNCTGPDGQVITFSHEEIAAAMFLYWTRKDRTEEGKVNAELQNRMVYALRLTGRLIDGTISIIDTEFNAYDPENTQSCGQETVDTPVS